MSIVNLIKTPQGYSIVQSNVQISRIGGKTTRDKSNPSVKRLAQQNFTIYPYISTKQIENNQKYLIIPAKSQWFNFNSIHEIEKKALPQWFKVKKLIFGNTKLDKFEKNEELYKKYRNYIVELGRNQYVSPTKARKGLAGDVCSIIKIHSFLEKWGLINFATPKKTGKGKPLIPRENKTSVEKRKDCVDKDKSIFSKNFNKDDLELLKKITRKYRPNCQFCQGMCGVIWYEYKDQLHLKQFNKNEETEVYTVRNSEESFEYIFRICSSCVYQGNIPVLLGIDDFSKKTVFDSMEYSYEEPKQKKKVNEQNKLLDTIEKNRFNIKKCAQILKLTEEGLYNSLIFMPLHKLQRMSRIQPETDNEQESQSKSNLKQNQKKGEINGHNVEPNLEGKLFQHELQLLNEQEMKLYEEFLQSWFLKVQAKMNKLAEWEKAVLWHSQQSSNIQQNNLAEQLKNKVLQKE